MSDPFDLQRFVDAQAPVYPRVVAELRHGQKQSHWMWFIFPQLAGLGHSPMARQFAIASREEAAAYLAHGVLGPRLRESTALVNAVEGRTIGEILGSPDDLKFCPRFKMLWTGLNGFAATPVRHWRTRNRRRARSSPATRRHQQSATL